MILVDRKYILDGVGYSQGRFATKLRRKVNPPPAPVGRQGRRFMYHKHEADAWIERELKLQAGRKWDPARRTA